MVSDEVAEALRRLKERHGLHNLAETIEKIVLSASQIIPQEKCHYAIPDQTGRLNCTHGNGHIGFCKMPCPFSVKKNHKKVGKSAER